MTARECCKCCGKGDSIVYMFKCEFCCSGFEMICTDCCVSVQKMDELAKSMNIKIPHWVCKKCFNDRKMLIKPDPEPPDPPEEPIISFGDDSGGGDSLLV